MTAQWLSDWFGRQFVVENRVGAGSNIAAALKPLPLSSAMRTVEARELAGGVEVDVGAARSNVQKIF